MSTTRYPLAIVIAHWQHHHNNGLRVIHEGLSLAENVVVVLGSAKRSRNTLNPFTEKQREELIRAGLTPLDQSRVTFVALQDRSRDEEWLQDLEAALDLSETDKVAAVFAANDSRVEFYEDVLPPRFVVHTVNATRIAMDWLRSVYFGPNGLDEARLTHDVPMATKAILLSWQSEPWYQSLIVEQARTDKYKLEYPGKRHATADALVTWGNYVLLIRRLSEFGNDLWAMPGGFVDANEPSFEAALRELFEETKLKLGHRVAWQSLVSSKEFDHPLRSPRAHICTNAYHLHLTMPNRPSVKARDDAKEAKWVHKQNLLQLRGQFFEDHEMAVEHFVGRFETLTQVGLDDVIF